MCNPAISKRPLEASHGNRMGGLRPHGSLMESGTAMRALSVRIDFQVWYEAVSLP